VRISGKEDRSMLKKILIPTDGSDHARKAIGHASDIATKYKATVYLIHVIPPLHSMAEVDVKKIQDNQQKIAKQIIEEAEREVKKKGVESYQSTILQGQPAREIIEFARKNSIDMIVMGSHGAGKVETFMLGSVSNKVCHLAECTCVTVK
jgi:nucleotide-binding universal stress UspA family protein